MTNDKRLILSLFVHSVELLMRPGGHEVPTNICNWYTGIPVYHIWLFFYLLLCQLTLWLLMAKFSAYFNVEFAQQKGFHKFT